MSERLPLRDDKSRRISGGLLEILLGLGRRLTRLLSLLVALYQYVLSPSIIIRTWSMSKSGRSISVLVLWEKKFYFYSSSLSLSLSLSLLLQLNNLRCLINFFHCFVKWIKRIRIWLSIAFLSHILKNYHVAVSFLRSSIEFKLSSFVFNLIWSEFMTNFQAAQNDKRQIYKRTLKFTTNNENLHWLACLSKK